MQKLLKRTAQAEKQVARRRLIKNKIENAIEGDNASGVVRRIKFEIMLQEKQARRARKETWTMGDLAPRRNHAAATADPLRRAQSKNPLTDFGTETFAQNDIPHWGSVSTHRVRPSTTIVRPDTVAARCAWAGTPKRLCLAVGDRVCVMEGHFKGSIGPIKEIKLEQGTVCIEGVARTNMTVPEIAAPIQEASVSQLETYIPLNAVRLVHPITDPATGETSDRIIRELKAVGFQLDRTTRRLAFSRIVPGLNVRIPWPRAANPAPEHDDNPDDTLRIDAEQVTFMPTLLKPPAPSKVLDELRNKYSRFRTRHEPEYIARKESEEAAKKAARHYAQAKGRRPGMPTPEMRTPLDEFLIQQKAARRERGQPELTEDMLERIGRLMAENKAQQQTPSSTAP